MRMPDNAGRHVVGATLDGEGDRGCWVDTTVWNPAGFPTAYTLSTDAGAYLCNETYHATLKALCEVGTHGPQPPPSVFLHLPSEKHISIEDGEALSTLALLISCAHIVVSPFMLWLLPSCTMVAISLHAAALGRPDAGQWEFPREANATPGGLERSHRSGVARRTVH